MKLKNGLRALRCSAREVQVGHDPQVALRVKIEHSRDLEVLRQLETEHSPAQLRRNMAVLGGRRERVDELLRELAKARLLTTTPRNRSAELKVPANMRELLAPEADTRALIAGDGWPTLAERAQRKVAVYGLGRTGANIALGLATAGVGRLHLVDKQPVRRRDQGQIYRTQDLGLARQQAITEILTANGLGCQVVVGDRWVTPDVAVLVDYEVADPTRAEFLSSRGIPHLSVVVSELGISCGPWVPAEGGPCLNCVFLKENDADPCWGALATQRFVRSPVAARGEDPSLASLVGSFAISQVLQALNGVQPPTHGRSMRVTLPNFEREWTSIELHPNCGDHRPKPTEPPKPSPPPPLIPLPKVP